MSLFIFNGFPSYYNSMVSFNRIGHQSSSRIKRISASKTPARDRIIDFGRHKGKMLGSLPSKYLKWVSKTLRARDFIEWAQLADEVLEDPIYKDRLEWEFAEKILTGDHGSCSSGRIENSVSNLLEIGESFGWDNEDKIAWKKIDFDLLGTSKGGRIPRRNKEGKLKLLSEGSVEEVEETNSVKGRRGERRERQKLKRGFQMRKARLEVGGNWEKNGDHDLEHRVDRYENREQRVEKNSSPFPGRESLIRKVLNNRRVL